MLRSRTLNFENLSANVEDFRNKKADFKYHTFLNKFPNGTSMQDCAICKLNINPYGVYTKNEVAICIGCFNKFIDGNAYQENIEKFRINLTEEHNRITSLQNNFDNEEKITEEKLNATFVGMELAEIEYLIGLPSRYGSFDRGLDSGFWIINKVNVEIWFQDLICTAVELT